jgi:hypothetical protein
VKLLALGALGVLVTGVVLAATGQPPVRMDIPPDREPSAFIVVPAEPDWFARAVPICDLPAWLSRAPQCLRKPTFRSRQ